MFLLLEKPLLVHMGLHNGGQPSWRFSTTSISETPTKREIVDQGVRT